MDPSELFAALAGKKRVVSPSAFIVQDGSEPDEEEMELLARMSAPDLGPLAFEEPRPNPNALTTNMLELVRRGIYRLRERVAALPKEPRKAKAKPRPAETLKETRDRLRREIAELERRRGKK
ncbi:MAG: hypothetical protein ABFD52_04860 [Acidobacteriota bacterium]